MILLKTLRESPPAPKFGDCGRTVKISVYWKCYGTAPAHMLGNIWVDIFLTLAALQSCQKNGRAHFEDKYPNMYKTCVKNRIKINKKRRRSGSGGCFGRSGGLPGAMSSRLGSRSGKMHTKSHQKCPIWWEFGKID